MKLKDLKEDKKLQFFLDGNDKAGYNVMSSQGDIHDHYDTRGEAQKVADELNRKYNRDPHIK